MKFCSRFLRLSALYETQNKTTQMRPNQSRHLNLPYHSHHNITIFGLSFNIMCWHLLVETNCGIPHILCMLLMNSCNTDMFFSNYYHWQSVRFESSSNH